VRTAPKPVRRGQQRVAEPRWRRPRERGAGLNPDGVDEDDQAERGNHFGSHGAVERADGQTTKSRRDAERTPKTPISPTIIQADGDKERGWVVRERATMTDASPYTTDHVNLAGPCTANQNLLDTAVRLGP